MVGLSIVREKSGGGGRARAAKEGAHPAFPLIM